MQLFSVDDKIFKKKKTFAHENMKNLPSKVAYFMAQFFFQYCQPAQKQPKSQFLFHKNCSPRDLCILTLDILMPGPCSAFQSVFNFGNRFYPKEKRTACYQSC